MVAILAFALLAIKLFVEGDTHGGLLATVILLLVINREEERD